jgi:hypothetical protein
VWGSFWQSPAPNWTTGGKASVPEPSHEDLQDRDGVRDVKQAGFEAHVLTKVEPDLSVLFLGLGLLVSDFGCNFLQQSKEISSECTGGGRWCSCQNLVFG